MQRRRPSSSRAARPGPPAHRLQLLARARRQLLLQLLLAQAGEGLEVLRRAGPALQQLRLALLEPAISPLLLLDGSRQALDQVGLVAREGQAPLRQLLLELRDRQRAQLLLQVRRRVVARRGAGSAARGGGRGA
jgi:hypothetical protein